MPPPDRIDDFFRVRPFRFEPPKPKVNPQPQPPPPLDLTGAGSRQSQLTFFGAQQRDRLERLIPFGTAGMNGAVAAQRGRIFQEASQAYHAVVADGARNFGAGSNTIEITNRALAEYRNVLDGYGVRPSEAPSFSILTATDFLNAESMRGGNLFTLDAAALRGLAQNGERPQYLARMLYTGDKPIDNPNQRLAYFDQTTGQGKTVAWATRVEDLAGSRMDYREVMSRIGWTASDIAGANSKDFKVIVFTEEAANRLQIPDRQTIISNARADANNFARFQSKPEAFWGDVVSYDYEGALNRAAGSGFDMKNNPNAFLATLSPAEAEIMQARSQFERSMGVNPLFTGDGTTMRPDLTNERVGVREYITDNTTNSATLLEMSQRGQVAFLDLHDLNTSGAPVDIAFSPARLPVPTERQMLASETRQGALIGGAFSAATSLPQVFEQYGNGDYLGATQTFVGNTALGTGVGAFSSAGERIAGNQIANQLSRSTFAQEGIERLYTNSGAARSVVSRFAGTEASNITSQTFNSTVRTMAGRIGGAGVVGGVVNGAFSAYDQIGAYNRGEVTASQAIGTVTGEAAVGLGAGMAGAAAGAAIGSIIPGAGTIVGGVIGFGVGMLAGYVADKGLRGLGVDKMIASGVTATIDAGAALVGEVQNFGREAANTINNAAETVGNTVSSAVSDVGSAVSGGLKSVFGW